MDEYEYCEQSFSLGELERISKITDFSKHSASDIKKIMDVTWLILKKEEAEEKELEKAIKQAVILITLFLFKRKGILTYDKKGRWKDTRLGKQLRRRLKKKEAQK